MDQMKTIIIIMPYFGKFPEMFPFWLESCKQNHTIDFLIATDQDLKVQASNIIIVKTSLIEIKHKLEDIVGFEIWLEKPYKLCDFKPLYNQLFSEYTEKYDFWGYCDCDLVFGNIRKFISDEMLNSNDYILGMGHFHFQRSHDEGYEQVWKTARGLWRNIHWKEVFKSRENEWFDELPYGVSGRYYEIFPQRFWSGFGPLGNCFDSPSPLYLPFINVYNTYNLYVNDPSYQNHIDRLPFWRRQPSEAIKHVIYLKEGEDLYSIGIDSVGNIIKRPILYAHFYKRKFKIKTSNTENYIIYPNVFADCIKLNKLNIRWLATNPFARLEQIKTRVISKIKRVFNGR